MYKRICIHKYYEEIGSIHKYYEEIRKVRVHKYYEEKMYPVSKQYMEYNDGFNLLNVMCLNIFKLFKNVTNIDIDIGKYGQFRFDLLALLSIIIKSGKRHVEYRIGSSNRHEDSRNWLTNCITPYISTKYEGKGWKISKFHGSLILIKPLPLE